MTFALQKLEASNEPVSFLELDLDTCVKSYGKTSTNLLTYSEDFSHANWSQVGTGSVTANSAKSPDGQITADLLSDTDTASDKAYWDQIISCADDTKIRAFSVYLKKGSADVTRIGGYYTGGTTASTGVNITWATMTISSGDIEEIGDGWYRVSFYLANNGTGNTSVRLRVYPAGNAAGPVGTVYAWGTQINEGYLTHYVPTTTASASSSCSATDAKANLLTYSEQFDNAAWTGAATVTANSVAAPDGTLTADTLDDNSAVANQSKQQNVTISDDSLYRTFSIYLKAGIATQTGLSLYFTGGTAVNVDITITWSTSTITVGGGDGGTGTITDEGNGWFRVIGTLQNNSSGNTTATCYIWPALWVSGGGTTGTVYTWGAQLVPGTSHGRYYKTEATAFSGTVGTECYNAFANCQDTANYERIAKTIRFAQPGSSLPRTIQCYACGRGKPTFTATKIEPERGLSTRGTVQFPLQDAPHHDRGLDPYVSTRTYDPESQGTLIGKLLARNQYYKGRPMRVLVGFLAEPFDWANFQTRHYVIDSIDGPDNGGMATVKGVDILSQIADTKAQAPTPSSGTLSAAYTAGVSTTLVLQTGEGVDYDTDPYTGNAISSTYPGYVMIGDNVLKYTGVSTDTLTGVVGGQMGTTDADAAIGDGVQQGLYFNAVNMVDVYDFLLKTYAGIPETYIPYDAGLTTPTGTDDEWDTEKGNWLSGNTLTRLIVNPTGIDELTRNLLKQNTCYSWWDEINQKVKLKAIAPGISNQIPASINDTTNLLRDSIKKKALPNKRISQLWVYYGQIDVTGDDKPSNYRNLHLQVDTNGESSDAHGEAAVQVIYANWLNSSALVLTLAGRLVNRFKNIPEQIEFDLNVRDTDFWAGDVILLTTEQSQDATGAPLQRKIQVLQAKENEPAQTYHYIAEAYEYTIQRYGFIMANGSPDYGSATDIQKATGCYISNGTVFSDGGLQYLIS